MTIEKKKSEKIYDKFAQYYDQIYHDKDYETECNFVISALDKFGLPESKKILDLACGTGNHSIILSKKGFSLTGIDLSRTAIEIAKKKAQKLRLLAEFIISDMTTFKLNKKFDACISLFSSICYLTDISQYKRTLRAINHHLKPHGLLVFDYWNGNAVVNERPSTKVKIVSFGKRRIIRIATPTIDFSKQICVIEYHCIVIEKNSIIDEFKEVHNIRYHFPVELTSDLNEAGFHLIKVTPMRNLNSMGDVDPYKNSWYLTVIARKR